MRICDYEMCTGCGMCVNICSHNAIELKRGLNDFMYPKIDNSLCVSCRLCQKKCPVNNLNRTQKMNIDKLYAAWNKDKYIRQYSSSGGVFSALAASIIEKGGVVAGVKWGSKFQAQHCLIDKVQDLWLLNGSKYVQSDTNVIYKQVRQVLEQGRYVLFSGTPCQNHALKQYLGKGYDKLYQIDLVCHGVPSYALFKRYLDEHANSKGIKSFVFRSKQPYWDYSYVQIENTDGTIYKTLTVEDSYFNLFNFSFSLRNSCHNCRYASCYRYSDITLADFWGFRPSKFKMRAYDKGVSLVLCNNQKGIEIFNTIRDKLVYDESNLQLAINGNRALSQPFKVPEKGEEFWEDYNQGMSIDDLAKKYIIKPYRIPPFLWLRRIYHRLQWIMRKYG